MIDNNIEDGTTSTGTPTTKTSGQFIVGNSGNDLNFLNINQTITCIGAGPISSTTNDSSRSSSSTMIESSINSGTKRGNVPIPAARRKSIHRKGTLNNDVLVVGTKTSIHVYDILHNSDLYYKEVI